MADVRKMTILLLVLALVLNARPESGLFPCGPCLCNKERTFTNCSSLGLAVIPEDLPLSLIQMDLSYNNIQNICGLQRYSSLVSLDASYNHLKTLGNDDFQHLYNLTSLDLHHNHLSLSSATYPENLFRHQRNLKKLTIHSNSKVDGSELQYPGDTFSSLISLEHLSIDGLMNPVFDNDFENLQNLASLTLEGNCNIKTLQNDTFTFMSKIRFLDVKNCGVIFIEPAAFKPLKIIRELDLSNNVDLGIQHLGVGLFGLQNSTIKKVVASRLNTYHGTGVSVKKEDVQHLKHTQLEELYFDDNRIEYVDRDVLSNLPTSIQKLSAKDNRFIFGTYLLETSVMTGLEWLDISGQFKSHVHSFSPNQNILVPTLPHGRAKRTRRRNRSVYSKTFVMNTDLKQSTHNYQDHSLPGNFTLFIPPNLKFVDASNSKVSFNIPRIQVGPNKIERIDLSYNFFTRWEGPVIGLKWLKYLDLSHNYCDYISEEFAMYMSSLKVANFSNNCLGYSLDNKSYKSLKFLESLDLSNNKITYILPQLLINSVNLEQLDLSSNYMRSWNLDIRHMANLTKLDISNNLFDQFPDDLQHQLSTKRNDPRLRVYITNNPLKCNCETLPSLKWIQTKGADMINLNNLSCIFLDGSKKRLQNLKNILPELEKSCTSYVVIMFEVLSLFLLGFGILVAGCIYRYRWKLRYLYYLTLNRHKGYLSVQDEEQMFEFDAFISYANEDKTFVIRDMRRALEESEAHEENFRLCIHHRDFLLQETIAANILKAINTSRKTIVILTKNFLKNKWCRYEVEMTKMESIYRGRNMLLIVVMEDIPVKDLPGDIVEQMKKDSYVEFTKDKERHAVFWQNIQRALRN